MINCNKEIEVAVNLLMVQGKVVVRWFKEIIVVIKQVHLDVGGDTHL